MRTDVAIIIVTYNSADHIMACLESIRYNQCSLKSEVIVVDNNSSDHTIAHISKFFPEVQVITSQRNRGFAAAVNTGVACCDSEHVLLLNPDTVVVGQAISQITDFAAKNPSYGVYGGRTLKLDGSLEPSSCWGIPSLWSLALFACGITTIARGNRILDPESIGGWERDSIREVGMVTGCFLLVTRKIFMSLGGLDERYFMYGEDVDFSIRARNAGYRPVINPEAVIIHEVGQSSASPTHKFQLLYRGKACLVRTHWRGAAKRLGLAMLGFGVGMRAFVSCFGKYAGFIQAKPHWEILWRSRGDWLNGYPVKVLESQGEMDK